MTKQLKFRWLLTAGAIASAILALSALASPTIRAVDQRYVKQSGYTNDRVLDSLKHTHELEGINEKMARVDSRLARVDSGITCLRRPSRPECQ